MEIKKGISQMAEYPNAEIDYVTPENGKMYYVMKDGVLESGAIIATLDPRHAIDESNECNNMGVFSEEGTVLVDFDKKDIKKITDNLVLAVESVPKTIDVVNALAKKNDEISRVVLEDNAKNIVAKMKEEMGPTGEMIIEDPYTEANVYLLDSYNNRVGLDCGFIGKNDKGLYFHTNNITTDSKFIKVDEFNSEEEDTIKNDVMIETPVIDSEKIDIEPVIETPDVKVEDVPEVEDVSEENDNSTDLKLDIDQDILEGFKLNTDEEEKKMDEETDIAEEENEEPVEKEDDIEEENTIDEEDYGNKLDNQVFENAIDTINKLLEETKKLSARIEELEEKLREKEEVIDSQDKMKDELNDVLDKANEVLDTIK